MMALNIAVPLTTVGDLMDGFGLLSPISPLSVDCLGVTTAGSHGKKQLVSPVGSESSGVSSLDSDEIKKPSSPPTTPTEEVERPTASSPLPSSETTDPDTAIPSEVPAAKSSGCPSTRSSLSSSDSISSSDGNSSDEFVAAPAQDLPKPEPVIPKVVKVEIGGRNVLNLLDNLTSPDHFRLQFAQLPENDNIHFFLDNRSQYHRLGANGHIQEYTMVKCKCCDFRYPVNGTSPTNGGATASMGQANLAVIFQQQQQHQTQQQQQQPFQWNSFNNYDSISNNRNKLGLNVAASAFNKTFGGGNNGSQYFRNNMATSLFGRDSNRSNNNNNSGGGNFLNNNSTSTYNNHKAYQQGFGSTNNNNSNGSNKFGSPYGNYQFQQQQQQSQQQQLFSKNNQQMRGYGSGNGNGSGGYNTSAAVAAAASALASQNMLNLNNFNGKNNNNNMFAYYKAMMN